MYKRNLMIRFRISLTHYKKMKKLLTKIQQFDIKDNYMTKFIKFTIMAISLIFICNLIICSIDECIAKVYNTECLCTCYYDASFAIPKNTKVYTNYAFSISSQNQFINKKNLIKSIFHPPLQLI